MFLLTIFNLRAVVSRNYYIFSQVRASILLLLSTLFMLPVKPTCLALQTYGFFISLAVGSTAFYLLLLVHQEEITILLYSGTCHHSINRSYMVYASLWSSAVPVMLLALFRGIWRSIYFQVYIHFQGIRRSKTVNFFLFLFRRHFVSVSVWKALSRASYNRSSNYDWEASGWVFISFPLANVLWWLFHLLGCWIYCLLSSDIYTSGAAKFLLEQLSSYYLQLYIYLAVYNFYQLPSSLYICSSLFQCCFILEPVIILSSVAV